jgi:hypothetical protein
MRCRPTEDKFRKPENLIRRASHFACIEQNFQQAIQITFDFLPVASACINQVPSSKKQRLIYVLPDNSANLKLLLANTHDTLLPILTLDYK